MQLNDGEYTQAQDLILGRENMRNKRDFVLLLVLPEMEGWEITPYTLIKKSTNFSGASGYFVGCKSC